MAVGDAVAVFLGTGTTNRQPSAGVEEKIMSIVKEGVTDGINLYDGTNAPDIIVAVDRTNLDDQDSTTNSRTFNMGIMITNSIYLRKEGTTDRTYAGGVQTNA